MKLGIVDQVLTEPTGGAHRNWDEMALRIKESLVSDLKELSGSKDLVSSRYQKYRGMGEFLAA